MRIPRFCCYALGIILVLAACSNSTAEPLSHLPASTSEIIPVSTPTLVVISSPTQSSPTLASSLSGTIAMAVVSRTHKGVALLDLKNNTIQDLSDHGYGSVSWSPDGQWVAISGGLPLSQRPPNIFIVKADGSKTNRLTNSDESKFDLNWSPDGNFIMYAHSNQGAPAELAVVEVATGASYSLTGTKGYEGFPTWSPDGKQIAYIFSESDNAPLQLWVMDSNGKNAQLLLDMPVIFGKIDWSPSDPYIAFVSGTSQADCGDVYVVKADGSSLARLTYLSNCATDVTWSPDGNYLAFVGRDMNVKGNILDWNWQIYVVDKNGKNIIQVTNEKEWRIDDIDWSSAALPNQ